MIEILTHEANGFSLADRQSSALVQIDEVFGGSGRFRLVLIDNRFIFSRFSPSHPDDYDAGTVSIGDKIIVDGEVYTVSARQYNSPVLIRATDS